MREILDYCKGGTEREVPAGTVLIQEGSKTGRLFVLIKGQLEVIRGDNVVAVFGRARRRHRRNVAAARSPAHRNGARRSRFDDLPVR